MKSFTGSKRPLLWTKLFTMVRVIVSKLPATGGADTNSEKDVAWTSSQRRLDSAHLPEAVQFSFHLAQLERN